MSHQVPQLKREEQQHDVDDDKPEDDERAHLKGGIYKEVNTSEMGRDSKDEKNGESSKVTSAERKYDECQGNNNNSPSEVESIPRRGIL